MQVVSDLIDQGYLGQATWRTQVLGKTWCLPPNLRCFIILQQISIQTLQYHLRPLSNLHSVYTYLDQQNVTVSRIGIFILCRSWSSSVECLRLRYERGVSCYPKVAHSVTAILTNRVPLALDCTDNIKTYSFVLLIQADMETSSII